MTNAERKRLEKQARKEELLRTALEKQAVRPNRVDDSLAELEDTVKRALKGIPRYEAIRPTYSAVDKAEAALEKDLEALRNQEREEAGAERLRMERIREEMEISFPKEVPTKVNLFAGGSGVEAVEAVTPEPDIPEMPTEASELPQAPEKPKRSGAWNNLLAARKPTKPGSS